MFLCDISGDYKNLPVKHSCGGQRRSVRQQWGNHPAGRRWHVTCRGITTLCRAGELASMGDNQTGLIYYIRGRGTERMWSGLTERLPARLPASRRPMRYLYVLYRALSRVSSCFRNRALGSSLGRRLLTDDEREECWGECGV